MDAGERAAGRAARVLDGGKADREDVEPGLDDGALAGVQALPAACRHDEDATIAAGTGALLGWKMLLLTLYTGFMLGGGIIILLLAFGRVDRKDTVPLVPFLAAGGLITLLAGPDILLSFGISPGWPW